VPIADLETDLVLARRDEKDDAVVLALLADAPGAAELVAVVLDVVAVERLHRRDHELVGGFVLERRELVRKLLRGVGRNDSCRIDDAPGERRECRRRNRRAPRRPQQRREDENCRKKAFHLCPLS
jgi:hypothetical protein